MHFAGRSLQKYLRLAWFGMLGVAYVQRNRKQVGSFARPGKVSQAFPVWGKRIGRRCALVLDDDLRFPSAIRANPLDGIAATINDMPAIGRPRGEAWRSEGRHGAVERDLRR